MELNLKKCKEILLDFRQNRTVIPPLTFNDTTLERVSAFKLLGLWIDDNLKWQTNTDYIIGKAVKRLFQLLKILKNYGADKIDMHETGGFTFLPSGRYLNMERKSGMGALLKHRAAVLRKHKEGH